MAGIYFHIPFCKRVCGYCDFYKSVRVALLDRVVGQMHRELDLRMPFLHERTVRTLYFGGGTPSLCRAEQIGGLIDHAKSLSDSRARVEECTVEANPDDLTPAYLEALLAAGVDRLSIGIQSLDDGELRMMNRRHTAGQGVHAVKMARAAGFANLSLDVIFGVEGFTGEPLHRTLEGLLALEPEHISAYHLTLEPGTAFGRRAARGELHAVDEEVSEREFLTVHESLTAAGYEHYEVSNYARKGFRARHNAAYWDGTEYLGIGPAAHSFNGRERCWSTDTAERYAVAEYFAHDGETLSERDAYNEYVMTRLRTSDGLRLGELSERFGRDRAERLKRTVEQWPSDDFMPAADGRVALRPECFLISDALIGMLFEE